MPRWLVTAFALSSLAACDPAGTLRWKVRDPTQVSLQQVGMGMNGLVYGHRWNDVTEVIPQGGEPRSGVALYRAGTVLARRDADGSVTLGEDRPYWKLVGADGAVGPLRVDLYSLPNRGTAWAFLASPGIESFRQPWQLRVATPRDNLVDVRVEHRRNKTAGAAFCWMSLSGLVFAGVGFPLGALAENGFDRGFSYGVGAAGAALTTILLSVGIYELTRRDYDTVLLP